MDMRQSFSQPLLDGLGSHTRSVLCDDMTNGGGLDTVDDVVAGPGD